MSALIIILLLVIAWKVTADRHSPSEGTSPHGSSSGSPQTSGDTPANATDKPGQSDTAKPGDAAKQDTSKSSGGSAGNKNGSSGGSTGGATGGTGGTSGGGDESTATCPAFPAFPDANCTGYAHTGVSLHACNTTLTGDNTTYDSCLFDGGIVVVGNNIKVTRSKITGIVSANWDANQSLRGLILEDVEIDGSPYFDPDGQAAIGIDNYTCIRCNVHHTGRGANFRNNVTIQDSYFHDFVYVSGAHQSAIGSNGGGNTTITHNNIQCNGVGGSGCSGGLVIYGDFDPVDNILVQNNLFNTDGSYCTYAGSTGVASGKPYPHGTNIRYLNNRFGKKYYNSCGDLGPATAWEYNSGNVWSGNAWQDGSGAINL